MSAPLSLPQVTTTQKCPTGETCSLDCLGAGRCGRVLAVNGEHEFRRRMLEMGFCNGAQVEMVRRAPFGDPIEYRLRGYCLSLRSEQAKGVVISVDESKKG